MQPLHKLSAVLAALVLPLAGGAVAQNTFTLDIDPAQSDWTWSGSTDLGPLQSDTGSNAFQMTGTAELVLTAGVLPIEGGQLTGGGDALVVPDLSGFVPNPLGMIFPPLAEIDVTNLHLAFSSPPFAIDGAGNFSTDITVIVLAGTLDVLPLVGTPTSSDLTGETGDPTPISGTVTTAGGTITFDSPQMSTFQFVDSASGITGDITLDGTILATWDCPPVATYCTAKVNSLGCTPQIGFSGTQPSWTDAAAFDVTAANVLNLKAGLLFYGQNGPAVLPFQGGTLCMFPPLRRTPIQFSGGTPPNACTGSYLFDLNAWIQSGADPFVAPGGQLTAQYWTRDPASTFGTGLTDALDSTVCP